MQKIDFKENLQQLLNNSVFDKTIHNKTMTNTIFNR